MSPLSPSQIQLDTNCIPTVSDIQVKVNSCYSVYRYIEQQENVATVAAPDGAEPPDAGGAEERGDIQRSPRLLRQLDEHQSQRGEQQVDDNQCVCFSSSDLGLSWIFITGMDQ